MAQQFFSGTSNVVVKLRQWEYPAEYKGKSRLAYYASLFSSVEINSTFYKLPQPATVAKWATEVPPLFRFTFKLFKGITHAKALRFNSDDVYKFWETIAGAAEHRGCVLIQLPPSAKLDKIDELEALLQCLNDANATQQWPLAIEFRHPTWYHMETYRLLKEYNAAVVMHDKAGSATEHLEEKTTIVYLRLHGPNGKYGGTYANEDLQHYAAFIKEELKKDKTVYAYFNNTLGGAYQNLQTLNNLIAL